MGQESYLTPIGWYIVGGFLALCLAFWLGYELGVFFENRRARRRLREQRVTSRAV